MKESPSRHLGRIKRSEFKKVFDKPNIGASNSCMRLVAKHNGLGYIRFGVTFVKKYGNAVRRNYSKRVLKDIFRKMDRQSFLGYDVVVVLYSDTYSYEDWQKQLSKLIQRVFFVQNTK